MIKIDYLVILDAGHSLYTAGKKSCKFENGTEMHEWEFNSEVVKKIFNKLIPYSQIDVFLTNTEKYDVSLDVRCQRANQAWNDYKAKFGEANVKCILISVHCNAFGDGLTWNSVNGTSTHYYPTNLVDKALAEVIHKNLIAATNPSTNRGIEGSNFQILREVDMSAVLCENLFMTNLENAKLLLTDEFRDKTATGIVNGILEYFKIIKIGENQPIEIPKVIPPVEVKSKVEYKVTSNGTHMLIGNVSDLKVKETNKSNRIMIEPNSINGTFFWKLPDGKKYSTSILYAEGITYQYYANHLPSPQSVFIVYKDNTIDMKRLHNLGEIDLNKVRLAIAGVGLVNKFDPTFKYDLYFEGFRGIQSDVARKTKKTMIVYNKKEDKIYLVCRDNIYHQSTLQYDLVDLAGDIGDIAVATDGGGSSAMFANGKNVFVGDSRVIDNIIYFS